MLKAFKRLLRHKLVRYGVAGICVVLILILYLSFNPSKTPESRIAVTTVAVRFGDLTPQIDTIGTAISPNETEVKSQVTGQLTEIHAVSGQSVKTGDLLFVIDRAPFQALLNQAMAIESKDQANVVFNSQQLDRYSRLAAQGYISKDFFSQILNNAKVAKASVSADQAAVATARLQLEHCSITAPINGRLGLVTAHLGDLVGANAATSLVSIKQFDPMEVQFSLAAKYAPLAHQALNSTTTEVDLSSSDNPNIHLKGVIDFVDNRIDAATATILLRALFPNTNQTLWPGQLVQIRVKAQPLHHVALLPDEAIQQDQDGGFYVYRIDAQDIAHIIPITTGPSVEGVTAVLSGVSLGDRIVTQGQFRLRESSPVSVEN